MNEYELVTYMVTYNAPELISVKFDTSEDAIEFAKQVGGMLFVVYRVLFD